MNEYKDEYYTYCPWTPYYDHICIVEQRYDQQYK